MKVTGLSAPFRHCLTAWDLAWAWSVLPRQLKENLVDVRLIWPVTRWGRSRGGLSLILDYRTPAENTLAGARQTNGTEPKATSKPALPRSASAPPMDD